MKNIFGFLIESLKNKNDLNEIINFEIELRLINSTPILVTDDYENAFIIDNFFEILKKINNNINQKYIYKINLSSFNFKRYKNNINQDLIKINLLDFELFTLEKSSITNMEYRVTEANQNPKIIQLYRNIFNRKLIKIEIKYFNDDFIIDKDNNFNKNTEKNNENNITLDNSIEEINESESIKTISNDDISIISNDIIILNNNISIISKDSGKQISSDHSINSIKIFKKHNKNLKNLKFEKKIKKVKLKCQKEKIKKKIKKDLKYKIINPKNFITIK